jgi:hypothetical protein
MSDTINICQFAIHYIFTDDEHVMDAYRFNKCEYNLLGIIQELSRLIGVKVEVEVEPLAEGSLWSRLKLSTKDKKLIKLNLISGVLLSIMTQPVSAPLGKIADSAVEYIINGSYIHNLKKEKERLLLEKEIRELRDDSVEHATLNTQNKLRRKVSNFYAEAQNDRRISSIGFISSAGDSTDERRVNRSAFDAYIIKDTMEDEEVVTNVRIDILAPVLRKRKIKWQGVYNLSYIHFKLCDIEFKKSVLKGDVDFTGGTYIICDLRICTSVDNEGETKISGYEVLAVHSCGKDDHAPVETESERKRKQKNAIENSPTLFDFVDLNES